MGLVKQDFNKINDIIISHLDLGINTNVFPGAVCGLRSGENNISVARGYCDNSSSVPTGLNIVYDLASLTKVVATAPLILLAIQNKKLDLDAPVNSLLPELSGFSGSNWDASITIRHLLSHTSGLAAWRPYYIKHLGEAAYIKAIASEAPYFKAGTAVEYSDPNFILLGIIAARLWDESLPEAAKRLVFKPLGMANTAWRPSLDARFAAAIFAPTEDGHSHEKKMTIIYAEGKHAVAGHTSRFNISVDDVDSFSWRTSSLKGEVHDGNAYYGLNGISGHAGLFSTLPDMMKYVDFWRKDEFLSYNLLQSVFSVQTPKSPITRGLAWLLDTKGVAFHTGFTGPYMRYDPRTCDTSIVLTNRVHPVVKEGIGLWRDGFTAELWE